ncbi:unnamed protein product [Cylindrotheca closterium]|uniref:Uncharacterized protein n=1 Tax=Cylindrotheca closterium TaxID=2856 RepID=A0AAD2JGM1_9STRA|nr:unnamed protein product [Cylindrotheca closterium]
MKLFIATLIALVIVGTNGASHTAGNNTDGNNTASANGSTCALDRDCESGFCSIDFTCKEKKEIGESCAQDDDCFTAFCSVDFTCKEKLAINETCVENDDCQSGVCAQLDGFKCVESSEALAWNLTCTMLGAIASFLFIAF